MAKRREEVLVTFLGDTSDYIKEVKKADNATGGFSNSVVDVDGNLTLMSDSMGDLGTATKQTTEGLIDSTTGMSGLGAALTSVSGRIKTAIAGLNGFKLALITTGIGALVVALGFLAANWDKVTDALGFTTIATDKQKDANNDLSTSEEELLQIRANASGTLVDKLQAELNLQQFKLDLLEEERLALDQLAKDNDLSFAQRSANLNLINAKIKEQKTLVDTLVPPVSDDAPAIKFFKTELPAAIELTIDSLEEYFKLVDIAIEKQRIDQLGLIEGLADVGDILVEENDESYDKDIANQKEYLKKKKAQQDEFDRQTELGISARQSFTIDAANNIAAGAAALADENQALQATILIGQAVGNGAVAITSAIAQFPPGTPAGVALPSAIAAITTAVGAQIAIIASALGADTPSNNSPSIASTFTETASSNFRDTLRLGGSTDSITSAIASGRAVLVTSDLDRVNGRVLVTDDRTSLG